MFQAIHDAGQANNIARNVERLASAQGIPGEVIEGLLDLKPGFRYNSGKTYKARDNGGGVDFTRLAQVSVLLGPPKSAMVASEGPSSPEVEPFGVRLAVAVQRYIDETGCQLNRLPKIFGKGKGKGVTMDDVKIALTPDARLPGPQQLRAICRKLKAAWLAPGSAASAQEAAQKQAVKPEKLPLTVENVGRVIDEVLRSPLVAKAFAAIDPLERMLPETWEWDGVPVAQAVPNLDIQEEPEGQMSMENWGQGEPPTVQAAQAPNAPEAREKPVPQVTEGSGVGTPLMEIPPQKEVKETVQRCRVSTKSDIEKAIQQTERMCRHNGLPEYGFFVLADLPQHLESIENMSRPSYWTEERIELYAAILNATPEVILGETEWDRETRDYGEIFAHNFEAAVSELGFDAEDVIACMARETGRMAANLKKQFLQSKLMPSYVDACRLLSIVDLRLRDVLDWTGERAQLSGRRTQLERLLDDTPKEEWVPAATFQKNIKELGKEACIVPTNVLWAAGVNDAKARASWLRLKKVPGPLIDACAEIFGLTGDDLAAQDTPRLPAGVDFSDGLYSNIEKTAKNVRLNLQELADWVDKIIHINCGNATPIRPDTIYEKANSGELLSKNNDTLLRWMLAALQTSLRELMFPDKEKPEPERVPCEWDMPADAVPQEKSPASPTGARQEIRQPPKNHGWAVTPGRASAGREEAQPNAESAAVLGIVKAPVAPAPQPRPEPKAVIPDGVDIGVALRSCFNRPVAGADKWSAIRVANRAAKIQSSLHVGSEKVSVKLINDILSGKDAPALTVSQLDAIIMVFYKGAGESIEEMESAKKNFFNRGKDMVVPQTEVCDTANWGMGKENGAILALNLRQAMKEKGLTEHDLALRLERMSHQKGVEAKIRALTQNTHPDIAPSNELIKNLAIILGKTKEWLCKAPAPVKDQASFQAEGMSDVRGMKDPVAIQKLYNNILGAGWNLPPLPQI